MFVRKLKKNKFLKAACLLLEEKIPVRLSIFNAAVLCSNLA